MLVVVVQHTRVEDGWVLQRILNDRRLTRFDRGSYTYSVVSSVLRDGMLPEEAGVNLRQGSYLRLALSHGENVR